MKTRELTVLEHALFSILEDTKLTPQEKSQHLIPVLQKSNEIKQAEQEICHSLQSQGISIPDAISGFDIDMRKNDETPLMLAAKNGDTQCIEVLLDFKADINQYCHFSKFNNPYKATPLMLAAHNGHLKCVTLLLEKKANMGIITHPNHSISDDSCAPTALALAIENNHADCAKALIEAGSNPNYNYKKYNSCSYLKSLLQVAVERSHFDCVKVLVESRANVNGILHENYFDEHPLEEGTLNLATRNKHIEIMEYLLKNGADPFIQYKFPYGAIPLSDLLLNYIEKMSDYEDILHTIVNNFIFVGDHLYIGIRLRNFHNLIEKLLETWEKELPQSIAKFLYIQSCFLTLHHYIQQHKEKNPSLPSLYEINEENLINNLDKIKKYGSKFRKDFIAVTNNSTSLCPDVQGIVTDYIGLFSTKRKSIHLKVPESFSPKKSKHS